MFVYGVAQHPAGVHLAFARTIAVDDRFFELVVAVTAEHVPLAPHRHSAPDVAEEL